MTDMIDVAILGPCPAGWIASVSVLEHLPTGASKGRAEYCNGDTGAAWSAWVEVSAGPQQTGYRRDRRFGSAGYGRERGQPPTQVNRCTLMGE